MSESENNITVCFTSTIPEQAREYLIENLKIFNNVQVIFPKDPSVEALLELVQSADILIG